MNYYEENDELIKDKKELKKCIKEIESVLKWMKERINTLDFESLDHSYFEDLMCLSSELYYKMGGN